MPLLPVALIIFAGSGLINSIGKLINPQTPPTPFDSAVKLIGYGIPFSLGLAAAHYWEKRKKS